MEIIGALKKSGEEKVINFYKYERNSFLWKDICSFLKTENVSEIIDETELLLVAVREDGEIVGLHLDNGRNICMNCSDLELFFEELGGSDDTTRN